MIGRMGRIVHEAGGWAGRVLFLNVTCIVLITVTGFGGWWVVWARRVIEIYEDWDG